MNNGKIENFGRPFDLLHDEKSVLYELVTHLDKSERDKLVEISKKNLKLDDDIMVEQDYFIEQPESDMVQLDDLDLENLNENDKLIKSQD